MPPKSTGPALNHMRMNRQQLVEAQALNRERVRQDEAVQERKRDIIERQKAKYAHAGSRVFAPTEDAYTGPVANSTPLDDVKINVFVRECEPDATSYVQLESALMNAAAKRRTAAPAAMDEKSAAQPPLRAPRAPSLNRAPSGSAPQREPVDSTRGQVPLYLRQRKAELEAEKAEAIRIAELRAEQAKYPPGHRPVAEEERQEILARLAKRRTELEADYGRLPMRYDTQSIQQRRKQIEVELQEVEAAERKFSVKKQLFVPI